MPFCVEVDGFQHFEEGITTKWDLKYRRSHDLIKMRFCVQRGISMLRMTSRTIRFKNWKAAFQRAVDRLTTDRALIVVEDNPQYRQMYRESLEGDSVLGPLVVFV